MHATFIEAAESGTCQDQARSGTHKWVHALTGSGIAPPRPGHEAVGCVVGGLGGDVQVVQHVRLAAGAGLALVDLQGGSDGNDKHVASMVDCAQHNGYRQSHRGQCTARRRRCSGVSVGC